MNNNIINTKINPKCTKCHCYFVSEIKSNGLSYKTCNRCRGDSKNKIIKINVSIIKEEVYVNYVWVVKYVNMIK